jgi:hypothetical protein
MGLSSLFKKKKGQTITQEAMQTDEQKAAMSMLSNFMQSGQFGGYRAGDAYGGSLGDYEMTDASKLGQSTLMEMLQGNDPAMKEFQSVLDTDKYDPYAEKGVYSGFKRNVMRESQEAKDALQRDLAMTGDMYSSDRASQLGILGERTSNALQDKLAELYDQYSQRRLGAADKLNDMQTQRVGLASTIGDMQRQLNDQKAKAQYADWNRARGEQQGQIDTAKTLFQKDVPFGVKSFKMPDRPSTFMGMLGEAIPAVGSYNAHKYGYTANQSSIGDALSGGGSGGIMGILKTILGGGLF